MLETDKGRFVLRAYWYKDRLPVEREHAIIAYARRQGVPAVEPAALPDGETILAHEERFYALFPHAPGQQMPKRALGRNEAVAMGSFLAQLHCALREYEHDKVAQRTLAVESAVTLKHIADLEQLIRARPTLDALDQAVLRQLTERRDWIEHAPENDLTNLLQLEQQVIHGDYQETNLFFDARHVIAIIDWDQAYVASRAWEIVRTLDLVFSFEPTLCCAFLDAYWAALPLDLSELEIATSAL
jgi:Ser/Thr protein kinase RdoA (MazF antagonist)